MSLEYGLVVVFAIIALGGVVLAGFLLWLRNREGADVDYSQHCVKHTI